MLDRNMRELVREIKKLRDWVTNVLILAPSKTSAAAPTASKHGELFPSAIIPLFSVGSAALLYFTGWMYLYYYLLNFQIDMFSVDVPFYFFFIYSFATITYSWIHWKFAVLLFSFGAVTIAVVSRLLVIRAEGFLSFSVRALLAIWLITSMVGVSFFLTHYAAERAAYAQYRERRFRFPTSWEFSFKKDVDVPNDKFLSALKDFSPDAQIVPIIETSDRYYVLIQPTPASDGQTYRSAGRVIEIPRDEVLFARLKLSNDALNDEGSSQNGATQ